jgi:hypothetical protein
MYMILFVLDVPDRLDQILDVWSGIGIRGVTIIESTGIQRRQKKLIPIRYLYQTTGDVEEGHVTLLALVDGEAVVQECLEAIEALIGDLSNPQTGMFAAWPLAVVKGVPKNYPPVA